MESISINDFESSSVLKCQSELTVVNVSQYTHGCLVGDGDRPISCTHNDGVSINPFDYLIRGWSGSRAIEGGHRVYYLKRRVTTPEEGYFNCLMNGDVNRRSGLYILYPSECPYVMAMLCCGYHSSTVTDVTAAIEVETGTVTFKVKCTSTGGRALNMAVSGPNGYVSNLTDNIQHVGRRAFMGNDSYTATSGIIYNGRVGDVYQCNVTSVESNTGSVTVQRNE